MRLYDPDLIPLDGDSTVPIVSFETDLIPLDGYDSFLKEIQMQSQIHTLPVERAKKTQIPYKSGRLPHHTHYLCTQDTTPTRKNHKGRTITTR